MGSKYASVAGLSSYEDTFLGLFFNFQNILSVQQLRTAASILLIYFLAISLTVLQKLIFENMALKNNQFS